MIFNVHPYNTWTTPKKKFLLLPRVMEKPGGKVQIIVWFQSVWVSKLYPRFISDDVRVKYYLKDPSKVKDENNEIFYK